MECCRIWNGSEGRIFFQEFPEQLRGKVRGCSSAASDHYLMLIDSGMEQEEQHRTLGHELAHIFLEHLDGQTDKDKAEAEAHSRELEYYQRYISGEL